MKAGHEIKMEGDISELTLAEILNDRSIDAIIAIGINYDIIAWNKTASLMYGCPKKEAIGKSLFDAIPGLEQDEQTIDALKNALCGHKSFVPVSKLFKHRLHAENHYIPLKDNDGNVIGVMNILHDVAHRIKAERQLQDLNEELEKRYRQLKVTSEELASFTYITSNKIKEPIRQMYTGVEYLVKMEGSRLSDSGKASFRRMQSSLNRMDLLLDDILRLAQISILQKPDTEVNLNELLQKVSDDVQKKHEKKAKIIIEDLCTISGHKDYLYILFYNLLDNGLKFNAADLPEIKISCEKIADGQDEFVTGNKYYKVTVRDNGVGFDSADAERIFTMFEKLHEKKYKGSGTGLTIARKIMNAHDGFISAESEDGKSASFHCFFPVQDWQD